MELEWNCGGTWMELEWAWDGTWMELDLIELGWNCVCACSITWMELWWSQSRIELNNADHFMAFLDALDPSGSYATFPKYASGPEEYTYHKKYANM